MFGRNREKEGRKKRSKGGPMMSRRGFLKRATVTVIAAEPVAKGVGRAAYNAAVNARYPIPPQKSTEVADDETILAAGYGDSIMAGYGAGNVPLTERVRQQAAKRGIAMRATSGAVDGSVATDIPDQVRRNRPRPRPGETLEIHVSSGHNDVKDQPDVVRPLQRLNAAPWDIRNWIGYLRARNAFRQNTRARIRQNVGTAMRETGAKRATVYGFPPAQDMPGIDNIGPGGRNDRTVIADDTTIAGRAKRLIAADLSRQGTAGVVDAAEDLRKSGAEVTVGSMGMLDASDFPRDQHPSAKGADKIAGGRAKGYKKKPRKK